MLCGGEGRDEKLWTQHTLKIDRYKTNITLFNFRFNTKSKTYRLAAIEKAITKSFLQQIFIVRTQYREERPTQNPQN